MKNLILSEAAGFCFGVKRSVALAEETLAEQGRPCYSLGQLIHNDAVVNRLAAQGLQPVAQAEDVPPGARVIIRSHGISKKEYALLEEKGCEIIDATCPKVLRIHGLVSKAEQGGRLPVIIGAEAHPEVRATCGWCDGAKVFSDVEAFEAWLLSKEENRQKPLTLTFQTTQTQRNLEGIKKILKKECTNSELFDTICSATSIRQADAEALAQKCDAMVVIGAPHSANSVHLAEICRQHCDRVFFISSVEELNLDAFAGLDTVGITASASAPDWIIKEVKQAMTDELKLTETTAEALPEVEMTFDQMLEDSIKTIYNGDTVTGIVATITPTEISVDLGTKHSGYIPVSEFTDETDVPVEQLIKIGDSIEACVVRVNDMEGTVMLSKKRLDAVKSWAVVEEAAENGAILEGTVTEENKGGIVVSIKGVRVFVPASQTGLGREANMSELMKKKVRLKITEVNRGRRRVVGSIRAVARDERRESAEKIWNEIEVGKRYDGVVKSLTGYGVFVDIGGIDGMIHVSELSWSRIKQPSDVMNVGDAVEVYVINFDKENRKISLGYKDPNGNPWEKFMEGHKTGDVAKVKIVKLMPFGAFAEVAPGVDGLIHISQISDRRIGKPEEVLSIGDEVEVKITAIDTDKQKISLSIRALLEPEAQEASEAPAEAPAAQENAVVYEVSATGEATGTAPDAE